VTEKGPSFDRFLSLYLSCVGCCVGDNDAESSDAKESSSTSSVRTEGMSVSDSNEKNSKEEN
jgi:hypothetical protein